MKHLDQVLAQAGFNRLQADIWAEFIVASFSALRAAQDRLSEPSAWAAAIKTKGFVAKRKGRLLEPGVSTELWHRLKEVTRAADPQDALHRLRIQFFPEPPVRSNKRTGTRSRRADIQAWSADSQMELSMFFEAKFLGAKADVTTYAGPSGIRRWTDDDGSYRKERWGTMMAYVTDAVQPSWSEQIAAALAAGGPTGDIEHIQVEKERDVVLLSWLHRDSPGDEAAIFHLQFQFPSLPTPSTRQRGKAGTRRPTRRRQKTLGRTT